MASTGTEHGLVGRVSALLGGATLVRSTLRNELDYVELVRRGIPYRAFRAALERLDLNEKDVLAALRLAPRTMARRPESGVLKEVESERVLRLARVATEAEDVLGSWPSAKSWLLSPNRALENRRPLDLLDTDVGTESVRDTLGRIAHGVFS